MKCNVFDWLLLRFEFQHASNDQSETLHRSLKSYVISMEFFWVESQTSLEQGENKRAKRDILLLFCYHSKA